MRKIKIVRRLFGLGLLLLMVAGCASNTNLLTKTDLGGKWEIIEYNHQTIVPAPHGVFPWIYFENNGMVSGQRGCNQWSGRYALSVHSKRLSIGMLNDGYLNCSQTTLDQKLKTAIKCIEYYKVLNRGRIVVLYRKHPKISIVIRKS